MTRILIATSEPVLARGLEAVLRSGGMEVTGICSDVLELFQQFHQSRPDVAFLDPPLLPAAEVIQELRRVAPKCQFVLWWRGEATQKVREASRWGCHAIPAANTSPERLLELVNLIACFAHHDTPTSRAERLAASSMERRMIALAGYGLTNAEIATLTNTGESTVELLLSSLADRLGAEDRYELALYGLSTLREDAWGAGTLSEDAV